MPAHALFLDYQEESGESVSVEVFPRADGSTHVTASDVVPLPIDPAGVKPEPAAIEQLRKRSPNGCLRFSAPKES